MALGMKQNICVGAVTETAKPLASSGNIVVGHDVEILDLGAQTDEWYCAGYFRQLLVSG